MSKAVPDSSGSSEGTRPSIAPSSGSPAPKSFGDSGLERSGLSHLRERTREIDAQLLTLALARADLVERIAIEKERLSMPVRDEARERVHLSVLADCARASGAPEETVTFVQRVFEGIFEASCALQQARRGGREER